MSKVTLKDENAYKEGTYFALLKTLQAIIMMIYPFSPFIAEEIYLSLPEHKESIMLESYPVYESEYEFDEADRKGDILKNIIEHVREYKVKNSLAPNAQLELFIKTNLDLKDIYPYISRFSFAKSLTATDKEIEGASSIILDNVTILVKDDIDKGELRARLEKELTQVQSEIKRSEGLLNNPNFVSKAPKAKIDLEKQKYENYKDKLSQILLKLKNI